MRRVWKFEMDPNEEIHRLELPQNSAVLGVGTQDGKIVMWVRFTSVAEKPYTIERVFRVAMTGQPFADDDLRTYVGTVQFEDHTRRLFGGHGVDYFVCHVFEETP